MSKKTVFVGMSGGVDSSVAALRLQKQGYRVVGVFIKVWHPDFLVCNWEQERLDAMRVADHLDIPFLTCDAEAAYRDEVSKYLISGKKLKNTPLPVLDTSKVFIRNEAAAAGIPTASKKDSQFVCFLGLI